MAVAAGSVARGWWVGIAALCPYPLPPRALRSGAEFRFCWAADRRQRLMRSTSRAVVSASLGWSAPQEGPKSLREVWKRGGGDGKRLLKVFCAASAQIQESPRQAWAVSVTFQRLSFIFLLKLRFCNSLAHLIAPSQRLGTLEVQSFPTTTSTSIKKNFCFQEYP